MKSFCLAFLTLCLLLLVKKTDAQDLDPRAYARIPVNVTVVVAGFGYSHGGIITDATLPLEDLEATIGSPSLGVVHSFSLAKRTAQVSVALPYAWGDASATISGETQSTSRSGFSDMRLRFSWLLLGAPASSPAEIMKAPRKTILGASFSITAPTGQFFPEKLINIGTSRWAFKPEIAISQPLGKRWLIDFYYGIWLFTKNDTFYPGTSIRTQDPLGSFQGHISYNIQPLMWVALDMTFYTGGRSSVDGVEMDDRQSNSRIGATLVLPIGKRNSIKFAYSTGAIIRSGADFTSVSAGWQTTFLGKPPSGQ
ncbi:MAG: transporter [Chlorobiaceae bacterium]|nr:transporter [Chlorobiaceae bacterium]